MARKNDYIDQIDIQIGKKIYELRLAHGMSRQELGDKIDVTHQQCQKYEKGTNRVSAGRLVLISNVFGKPISHFYENVENNDNVAINTHHQRMCIEIARNFMKIKNSDHQNAVNSLVKTLAEDVDA